jgi:hypothetical protein
MTEFDGDDRERTPAETGRDAMQRSATSAAPGVAQPDAAAQEDEIRRRAYEIYLSRGDAPGSDIDDWLAAEREARERGPASTSARRSDAAERDANLGEPGTPDGDGTAGEAGRGQHEGRLARADAAGPRRGRGARDGGPGPEAYTS